MSTWRIDRRTVLKGSGYSLLLPLLEVMMPRKARADTLSPPRFVALFLSLGSYGRGYDPTKNGAARYPNVNPWEAGGMRAWVPATAGAFTAPLPPALAPLEALKDKLTIVSGLSTLVEDKPAAGQSGNSINHSTATTLWLTSAWRNKAAAIADNISNKALTPKNAIPPDSIDQAIANAIGLAPGSTLALSPSGNANYSELETGGHGGAISYNSKFAATGSTLVPRLADAKAAFNSLFVNCADGPKKGQADQKSVLDYVLGSIGTLQKKVSTGDKARLDSYFQNIRELELKVAAAGQCPTEPAASPPLTGGPLDQISRLNLLVDVLALAVSSGAMPIATLMTSSEAGDGGNAAAAVDAQSDFIGIDGQRVKYHVDPLDTHNGITHVESDTNTQATEEHIAYTQMNIGFAKRLIGKLASMPAEPNGYTPLDNTVVLVGAAHCHAAWHATFNLPTLLAGGKRFGLNQGRHVAMPMFTDIGDLHFTMAKAMGVALPSFNGRSTRLNGIFG